jgi:chaperonin GroEL
MLTKFAIKDLDKSMLMKLALTSCNWDMELASAIVEASEHESTGAIVATPNFGGKTELSVADRIDVFAGIVAPEFIENIAESETVMNNPRILVSLSRLEGESDIIDMVDKAIAMEEEDIVILMPGAEMKSVAALKVNHLHGAIRILPVMVGTISGNDNADALFDLSVSTGATALGTSSGVSLSTLKDADFGSAERVIYSKGRLIIEKPKGDQEKRDALASSYIEASNKETLEIAKEALRRRSSLVSGKSVEIKIGGENKSSVMEKKDRADDAIQAIQNSIKHGVLPGGGMAYTYLAKQSFSAGFEKALMCPLQILSAENAVSLTFELYKEPVCYSSKHGIVGISSEEAPIDSLDTVLSVLEQAIELAKLITSVKATVISNTQRA